jgi:hypothetical protein
MVAYKYIALIVSIINVLILLSLFVYRPKPLTKVLIIVHTSILLAFNSLLIFMAHFQLAIDISSLIFYHPVYVLDWPFSIILSLTFKTGRGLFLLLLFESGIPGILICYLYGNIYYFFRPVKKDIKIIQRRNQNEIK